MFVSLPNPERLFVHLDDWPLNALWRIGLGYLIPFLYYNVFYNEGGVPLIAWFLCVLVALRIIPIFVRRIIPCSAEVNSIWAQRRRFAKVYDSYQWGKLIWFGIGMAVYITFPGCSDIIAKAFTVFLIIGGALGLAIWRRRCISENIGVLCI